MWPRLEETVVTKAEERLVARLEAMVEEQASHLAVIAWVSEADRWAELVFCVLNAVSRDDPRRSRAIVETLRELNIIEPARLAEARDTGSDVHVVIRHVLRERGFSELDGIRTVENLARVGDRVTSEFGGKLQKYLRLKGASMRDELVRMFSAQADDRAAIERAVTHWLQNAASLPISVDDDEMRTLYSERGIDKEAIEAAADYLDLNVAVIDDLLRLDAVMDTGVGSRS